MNKDTSKELTKRKIIDIEKDKAIHFMEYEKDKFTLTIDSSGTVFYKGNPLDTEEEVADSLLHLAEAIQEAYNL